VKNVQKVINAFNQMRYLSNVLLVNTEFWLDKTHAKYALTANSVQTVETKF
jgi:hypothetical protein